MSTPGIEILQSRIAQIQNKLGAQQSQAGSSLNISSDSPTFNSTLASLMQTDDTTAGFDSPESSSFFNTSGTAAVNAAKRYLGVPYVWGGTNPSSGLDCSGLVQRAYADLGVSLPRVAADQARQGTPVASLTQAKLGDLVCFGSPVDHIGIYAGDNKMIVAPKRGDVVKVQDIYTKPTAIRRIMPDSSTMSLMTARIGSVLNNSNAGGISSSLSSRFDSLFATAAAKYQLPPALLAAVAKQESGFNPNAISPAGARGLMQIMPSTAQGLGVNPMDPSQAVDGAAKMLSGLISRFGSTELALAAYNAGAGAVTKYNGIPPYKETQNYVKAIMASLKGASL